MASSEIGPRDDDTRLTTQPSDGGSAPSTVVPGLTILAHPTPGRIGERVALPVLALGREVRLSRLEPVFRPATTAAGGPLADLSLSRQPLRLAGGGEPGTVLVDASRTRTSLLVDGLPVAGAKVLAAADVERGVVLQLGRHVVLLLHRTRLPWAEDVPRFGLVGESEAIVRLRQEIEKLIPLDVPVLLHGETGTGKELVARALHDGGPRATGPFVAVNMATLTPSLAAAELFGAERGAYTGAERQKKGFFRSAEGGTFFLDEIGEAPVEVQAMLLRALESREIVPVGGAAPQPVDVRFIAATDVRFGQALAEGRFRAPLYHRLAGYALQVPALRERRDDVARLLAVFFAEELARLGAEAAGEEPRSWPPAEVVARLARYDWPGNVRELRNVARRLAIAGRGATAEQLVRQLDDLLGDVGPAGAAADSVRASTTRSTTVTRPTRGKRSYRQPHEVGDDELLAALAANGWRIQPTAARLGVSRTSLYAMIDRSKSIRRASDLGVDEIAAARQRHGGDVEAMAAELRVSPSGLRHRLRRLATTGD